MGKTDEAEIQQGAGVPPAGGDMMGMIKRVHANVPTTDALFGKNVQIKDGLVVVANPTETVNEQKNAGVVYILNLAVLGSVLTAELMQLQSAKPEYNGMFGKHVAIQGGIGVIGAPGETVHISKDLADVNAG